MKIFHTADWHLGKLVQGVYMTEDQAYILQQFLADIDQEKPDVIIVAGDLYDRAVPPTEAVRLLDDIFAEIVLKRHIPLISIAGNHDSPGRLHFGSQLMKESGLHIVGNLDDKLSPVVLTDEFGEVHFHLIPYADPSQVRYVFDDDSIKTHQSAMKRITDELKKKMDPEKRHVFVGHAFVTSHGQEEENTSESERPLAIGGTECIDAALFEPFHYTALGHLHQAHFVLNETIRYAGSPLKYSISEENHKKGYLIVDVAEDGQVTIEKKLLQPRRDMRTVEDTIDNLLKLEVSEDYIYVKLLDDTPIISPMEKIRTVFPNAMHVERKMIHQNINGTEQLTISRQKMDDLTLFEAFYKEIVGAEVEAATKQLFQEVLQEGLAKEREVGSDVK
ncbi:exonuclease SbcCD subunit D [Viridibacillus sp. FSL R5-0477]|uniref:Nuclease SbcCD subunit D n=1 Tax=Viridibacillus arenosi FSL R5-213 TaxID=1227360 RepID=W4F106_9BACL|nr:exonuclease SbcCD subunit D [Viridibacillus arenosi]ETT86523.1 exonuclease SbcD [Viridibacillus arenosi FSL R5-213]OMC91648.1 exonuclease sbcCD subunit D [Viridibacillus arenosi]